MKNKIFIILSLISLLFETNAQGARQNDFETMLNQEAKKESDANDLLNSTRRIAVISSLSGFMPSAITHIIDGFAENLTLRHVGLLDSRNIQIQFESLAVPRGNFWLKLHRASTQDSLERETSNITNIPIDQQIWYHHENGATTFLPSDEYRRLVSFQRISPLILVKDARHPDYTPTSY